MFDGFIKTAAATPEIRVADCKYNAGQICGLISKAELKGVKLLIFPELCVTGYTCQDLFLQNTLIDNAMLGLETIAKHTAGSGMLVVVGCPLIFRGQLYNCAVVLQNGSALGIVPKKYLPNYNEFYELRHFAVPEEGEYETELFGKTVPFGLNMMFECRAVTNFTFAVEICEDLWSPIPPSCELAVGGAEIIANLSASNETIGKEDYRRSLVVGQSARLICGYVFSGAGEGESTQDLVFGGHRIISENGKSLAESELYTTGLTITEIDVNRLAAERRRNTSFRSGKAVSLRRISFDMKSEKTTLTREFSPLPFVPSASSEKDSRCGKILSMQAHGLAKRIKHTNCKTVEIGISGGLDSCLALLVCVDAMKILNRPMTDIIAVTMPCFGTTKRTRSNAETLCSILGVTLRVVDITESVRRHFKDIGHDENNHNVTYENCQARERTQVLMDIANEENGMVIGTGDLSELALGWATYNGDQMSMYGVNASVPKTLVRHIVAYYASQTDNPGLSEVLISIYNTPVSPELLPAENGEISQITEDLVGPYELHDFFLYYSLRWGFPPKKVFRLAEYAFKGRYDSGTVKKWLKTFYRRFFSQQFKRSCMPDGVKVGTVTLSPRGDLRMPSDAIAWNITDNEE